MGWRSIGDIFKFWGLWDGRRYEILLCFKWSMGWGWFEYEILSLGSMG